jgi:hypothetical protein
MRRKSKAKLYLRFRTSEGKQSPYCPALFDHKSRIRPFWCLVKGVEELHREETYYRRAKRDGTWKWESLGNDANAAYAKLDVPPVIPFKPAGKNEAAAPTMKDGFRIDDEIAVYLSNVSKLGDSSRAGSEVGRGEGTAEESPPGGGVMDETDCSR